MEIWKIQKTGKDVEDLHPLITVDPNVEEEHTMVAAALYTHMLAPFPTMGKKPPGRAGTGEIY